MKKTRLIVILLTLVFIATGCFNVQKRAPVKSSLFKTFDRGETWMKKAVLMVTGGISDIGSVQVNEVYLDPHDNNAIYVTTSNKGLLYSYNGGENWQQPPQLRSGNVLGFAVDTIDKCVIYASVANRVLKSSDCNRSYAEVLVDTRSININALVVHPSNNAIVYAATSKGEIIQTRDAGRSWNTIFNHRKTITHLLFEPTNSQNMYLVSNNGFFASTDSGVSWESFNDGLKPYSGGTKITHLVNNPSVANSVIIVSKYGILRSDDGGETWNPYNLITPPAATKIYAFAVSPQSDRDLYYTTATTFYRSEDGGKSWIVKRLPSPAQPSSLLIDPVNPSMLYMGSVVPVKK
jgi:photosystem II stability/assembly factor-like uncharacterized protein